MYEFSMHSKLNAILGKIFIAHDGRKGIFVGCMESDDEFALKKSDGSIFTIWVTQLHSILPNELKSMR